MKLFKKYNTELLKSDNKNVYCLCNGGFYLDDKNFMNEHFDKYVFYPKELEYDIDFNELILYLEIIMFNEFNILTYVEGINYFKNICVGDAVCDYDLDILIYKSDKIDIDLLKKSFDTIGLLKHKIYGYKNDLPVYNKLGNELKLINEVYHNMLIEVYTEHNYIQLYIKDNIICRNRIVDIFKDVCLKFNKILEDNI